MIEDSDSQKGSKKGKKKVLLVGWDGADWEHITPLLDKGLMPGLESLINRGVMGNLATLHPVLSPMLWNSISTGKTADKHGILGFTKPLSSGKGIEPFPSTSRKVKAIWNILHQNDMRSNVVSWWASHPAEPINGCMVSNLFNGIKRSDDGGLKVAPHLVSPKERTDELAGLKVHVDEINQRDVLPFIPHAHRIDQSLDPRLFIACKLLSDCASIQAVTTHLMETEEWDLTAVYFDSIDHFCHAFMYYHPPKMSNISDDDFEIYKDVIKGAYQFHDMILQRLVYLAGEEATVILCSDHGFQSGAMRPLTTPAEPAGPAAWHRDLGIIVMAGPGIKQDERIYGANLIDVTPTILYQLGLPIAEDMDGRVMLDAFENPSPPTTIPSWEEERKDCGMHRSETIASNDHSTLSETAENDLVQQFVALGYINDPGEDLEKAARNCQLEIDYNLGRVYLSTNRYAAALEIFEKLVIQMPWEDRYWKNLAQTYFELGYYLQAHNIILDLYRDIPNTPPSALVFLAKTSCKLGNLIESEEFLQRIAELNPNQPMLYVSIGNIYLEIAKQAQAKTAFEKSISLDADSPYGYLGLAELNLKQGNFQESASYALSAISLVFRIEKAHLILGLSMYQLQHFDRAVQAFKNLLSFENGNYHAVANRLLAQIARKNGDDRQAEQYQQASLLARKKKPKRIRGEINRIKQLFELPNIPSTRDRKAAFLAERPRPQRGGRQKAVPFTQTDRVLTIVSGLPRSGTSLMMQMLDLGGMSPKSDGFRTADIDNPEGYFEWEAIKKIGSDPSILDDVELDQKAIKVISMLLGRLPKTCRYKVIFMQRPSSQVAASQQKMLFRLGKMPPAFDLDKLIGQLDKHVNFVHAWLSQQSHIDYLVIDYPDLIQAPESNAKKIFEFLGPTRIKNWQKMFEAVNPDLYRNI